MDGASNTPRLSKSQLLTVEKSLFELTRKQKGQTIPIELSLPNFWTCVGQLLQNLEVELAETVREEGMTAKAQLQSRRLGVVRTCVTDLTRLRLNAFTQHAILSNLMRSPEGDAMPSLATARLEWDRHDPSERAFHAGIGHLVEKYKHEVSWGALLGATEQIRLDHPPSVGHKPLSEFSEEAPAEDSGLPSREPSRKDGSWDEPEYDEEDRIRELDAFPEHASSQAESKSVADILEATGDSLLRIRILKNVSDPIVTADGTEMNLTEGDIESCPSLIAETLIAAGLAEPAPI
ncbi:MAG: hypothetical protein QGF28_00445 [Candidatus Thalassarchaeaceae archaeon]|jgi:hypothetical protein|nr:hypothetical protein [Candidatus Thalassarchaeaceae archaeon]MDP7092491.1 hypothetical protein [Candidatus Thalassarchaeaceae archaeon]MDP7257142.1 hypothetical protein [Candidatus Thalassarchaeaceae archaeon]MDP7445663.1 hypothetical protein [Candidatus Thalassarchaeaceae archaeon]MDP7649891.1 hypothetical protein [Candidatus Thalassarchaeaceae archaeon]|tara:strand:+ start:3092 stop:3967 length:876 start_codon:yes stop_codon:yes gene_type:complete